MKKVFLLMFICLCYHYTNAQFIGKNQSGAANSGNNTTTGSNKSTVIELDGKTKYTDYKVFKTNNDTVFVDTTLTLQKDFKFNYIRKDDFELLPFHNQGQTYNRLAYDFDNSSIFPKIGMTSKQYNYTNANNISYYYVPTPTSEFMYRTGLEQGQMLDAFLTMNTSKQFNFSLGYKGLRSLGKYRQSLSSHGNFTTTFNYHSKFKTYFLKGHFYSFDLLNQENGGLPEESIAYFESNDPNYTERGRLEINYTDSENMMEGKRYYLDQSVILISKKNKARKIDLAIFNSKKNKLDSINKAIETLKLDSIRLDSLIPKIIAPKVEKPIKVKKDSTSINTKIADSVKIDSVQIKPITKIAVDTLANNDSIPVKLVTKTIDTLTIKDSTLVKPLNTITINTESIKDSIGFIQQKLVGLVAKKTVIFKNDSIAKAHDTLAKVFIPDANLKFGHRFKYETRHYRFKGSKASFFGDSFESPITDHTSFQEMDNQAYLELNSASLGKLRVKGNYYKYNYNYNSILYLDTITISNELKGNVISAGADWNKNIGKLNIYADANSIISGDLEGNTLKAAITYKKDSTYSFKGFAEVASVTPSFNKILYQSDYKDYNWQNDFKNEEIKTAGIEFKLPKWGSIKASYNLIDNFTYFDTISKPVQAKTTLNYVKAKVNLHYTYRNFTLDNTVMYQHVLEGEDFFHVPQLVTRNTFYYANYLFKKKSLYLQTGVTFKYFTLYKANAYNPLISEFILQDKQDIGNYPILDFFVNAQIQRTRLYLKVENFTASFTGRNYYVAPSYPYRDLIVRFGLVWNFFI